jgi:hypothetical protein
VPPATLYDKKIPTTNNKTANTVLGEMDFFTVSTRTIAMKVYRKLPRSDVISDRTNV